VHVHIKLTSAVKFIPKDNWIVFYFCIVENAYQGWHPDHQYVVYKSS